MKIITKEDKDYPQRLLELKKPPEKLYVKGNEKLLNNKSLAIVGSRRCTEYGIKYTKIFANTIANHNITIVSGLALGIDAMAHEAAQNCTGNTIAVLGCGLNHIYPKENERLLNKILENNGCIISEYEPDEPIDMKNFPKRNKIVSGISNAIFVVEAGWRSGSTITGHLGLKQGKNVFCLPRDIETTNGIGTNELIQKGAKLVTSPQDILEEFGIHEKVQKAPMIRPKKQVQALQNQIKQIEQEYSHANTSLTTCLTNQAIPEIPQEQLDIYKLLSYTPQNIQHLIKSSGLSMPRITQKLMMLELQGYIKSLPR